MWIIQDTKMQNYREYFQQLQYDVIKYFKANRFSIKYQ